LGESHVDPGRLQGELRRGYAADVQRANLRITSALARRNVGTPTPMRGPGAVPGLWATESAMDELALKLGMDPVDLRLANEPQIDEGLKIPFSSRHLKECLSLGAERFGWSKRDPRVGSMKRGGLTLGWGMASCSWQAARFHAPRPSSCVTTGRLVCRAPAGLGTGSYTIVAQLAAEKLGLPLDKVEAVLGDTRLPPARFPVDPERPRPWYRPSLRRLEGQSMRCWLWPARPRTSEYTNGRVHSRANLLRAA